MLAKIEAHERNVGDIFSDSYEFEIPPYQRPYAWEEDQTRELLDDLLDAMDNKDASGGLYFLGSIVLVKSPTQPQSKVIDGQQRLTTLTILLSVLRDLTSDEERRIERRRYVYQKASADRGLKESYRLLLRESDRPFFLKHVQIPGATDTLPDITRLSGSQLRIGENAKYLRSKLEELPEERRDALVAFVIQHCYLVVVAVPTAEAARRIFTVLNARGLDLTPTDILKADLLERAGTAQEGPLAKRWEVVEQSLGRERMVEVFGHLRMIYERDKPRLALEAGFQKYVAPFSQGAEAFVSNFLEPIADAMRVVSDDALIKKHFGADAAKAVRSLSRIDNKDWVPPALLRIWRSNEDDKPAVAKFLIDLERLAYFLFVTRTGVNDRIARFAAVMDEFDPRPNKETTKAGLELSEEEEFEFVTMLSGRLYQASRVCKPVMQRLDEALSSGGASYDELVSIEHVLPQTVDAESEWAALFPEEQQRSYWTHRLANLVFLTRRINTRASNWDFERKKKEYFSSKDGSSPFVITQAVLQTKAWTPDHLEERQRELLEALCSVWRLDPSYIDEQIPASIPQDAGKATVDVKALDAKREHIMKEFAKREGITFTRKGATYWNQDKSICAVCTVSRRHPRHSAPYWYGYSLVWQTFFRENKGKTYVVLGCLDKNVAYAIPASQIEDNLENLHRSEGRHWHIVLQENENGSLDLVPKTGPRIPLAKFELKVAE